MLSIIHPEDSLVHWSIQFIISSNESSINYRSFITPFIVELKWGLLTSNPLLRRLFKVTVTVIKYLKPFFL